MTWTYDLSQLATSTLFQTRYLMGDTLSTDKLVQDEEIQFALTQRKSTYGAAATCCRALAARLSREADTVDKDLRDAISQRARAFMAMANDYESQAQFRSGAVPYAGGISISDRSQQIGNTDRVQPQFNIGMQDNYVPDGIVGNEDLNSNND